MIGNDSILLWKRFHRPEEFCISSETMSTIFCENEFGAKVASELEAGLSPSRLRNNRRIADGPNGSQV
jgi:hypothetical protein